MQETSEDRRKMVHSQANTGTDDVIQVGHWAKPHLNFTELLLIFVSKLAGKFNKMSVIMLTAALSKIKCDHGTMHLN